jgi:hypothetical protein
MKKQYVLITIAMVLLLLTPLALRAGDFDGSKPLILSLIRGDECTLAGGCNEVTPEDVGLPQFLKIDFEKKQISATPEIPEVPPSVIERMEVVDGKLMLQGAEDGLEGVRDGLGWTIAISLETGQAVLTGSGDGFGLVIFGACLPL